MLTRKQLAALLGLCLTGAVVTAANAPVAASAPTSASAAVSAAAPAMISMHGGDVITLASPRTVLAPTRVGTSWRRVSAATRAALPTIGVAAVLVSVNVSSAIRAGTLNLRPTGAPSNGQGVVSYGTRSASGLSLVKLGTSDSIDVRTTGGQPSVGVRVVGYVPELAPLVVPETAAPSVAADLSTTTGSVRLAGVGPVPPTATALVVAVTTVGARAAGSLRAWRPGSATPSAGLAYPSGTHVTLATLRPDTGGLVRFRATGRVRAGFRVLGWSSGSTTLNGLARPESLASVSGGTTKPVAVVGRSGIPSTAQDVAAVVNAPRGATVRIWRSATGTGTPVLTAVSDGGSLPFVVAVPTGKKLTVRVTGTRSSSTVVATGYVSRLGDQALAFAPLPGTRILGAGDVLAEHPDATIDLARSADPVTSGDVVMARPRDAAPYVARVTSVATSAGGMRTLSLETATLQDAFADYRATYHGPLEGTQPVTTGTLPAGLRAARAALSGGDWTCTGEVSATPISIDPQFSGSGNLDVDLGARSVDLSLKGRVSVTVTFAAQASVSCEYQSDLPITVPLGTTGLAAKMSTKGTVTIGLAQDSEGGTFSVTAGVNAYAAYWYFDGESDSTLTGAPTGSASPDADGLDLTLEVGFSIAVGPATPKGLTEIVDASGSFTFGMVFKAHPPDYLRGPKCLDVTLNPFAEIGASLVVPFFEDINVSVARVDFEEATLYRGPCWGYSGTVTFNVDGTYTPCDGCDIAERHNEIVWTMNPQPARFLGGGNTEIYQPYTWSATVSERHTSAVQGDPAYRCVTTVVGSGAGTRGFDDSPGALVVGEASPAYYTDANVGLVQFDYTYSGGNEVCLHDPRSGEGYEQISPQASGPQSQRLARRTSITDTWQTAGPFVHKVTFALTRQEFAR